MSFQQEEAARDLADVKYKAIDALFNALRLNGWSGITRDNLTQTMNSANPQSTQDVYNVVLKMTSNGSGLEEGPGALTPTQVSSIRNTVSTAIAYDASHEQDYFDTNGVNGSMDQVAAGTFDKTSAANAQAAMGGDLDGDGIPNSSDATPNAYTYSIPPPSGWVDLDSDGDGTLNGADSSPYGYSIPAPSGGVSSDVGSSAPAAPMFTLIKAEGGDGSVYVLNNRNERFHVSETLMNEMIAGGSWSEPIMKPQAEVDGMALRYTVDSTANLGTINNPPLSGNLMLIQGNGPTDVPDSQLTGNGNAIFAVNDKGQKFHVTPEAFAEFQAEANGTPPIANITQAAVDSQPLAGGLAVAAGQVSTVLTPDNILDTAVGATNNVLGATPPSATPPSNPDPAPDAAGATPPPAAPAAPADEALSVSMSGQGIGAFNFVRDDASGAIYAVNAGNQKFHVTGDLWNQLSPAEQQFRSAAPGELDGYSNGSTDLQNRDQLRAININAGSEFRLVKGRGGFNADDGPLEGNSSAVYALTSTGDRYHVTKELASKIDLAGIEEVDQSEVDSMGTMRGSLNTVADLNHAVKDQSHIAGGFDGDTSSMPGGIPPMPGYTPQS